VHEVGDFVASFVPSLDDFGRLDKRFRLPRQTWNKIPAYRDWGFAVFQLKATGPSKTQQVHPMAFTFPTRLSGTLFFPTVHIHDGKVHPTEQFDHALYFQTKRAVPTRSLRPRSLRAARWLETSAREAGQSVNVHKARGMVWGGEKCFRLNLRGDLPNQDTLIRLAVRGALYLSRVRRGPAPSRAWLLVLARFTRSRACRPTTGTAAKPWCGTVSAA
jgi:hypothetical protein